MDTPRETYRALLAARRQVWTAAVARHEQFGYLRLLLFALLAFLAWKTLYQALWSAWYLLLPLGTFLLTALFHNRILERRDQAARSVRYFERCLQRLDRQWAGVGSDGQAWLPPHHVYAADLDLFGPGNLFQWLNQARTRMGEKTLADWLLHPADARQVQEREQAVRELVADGDLRERVYLVSEAVAASVHPDPLRRWAEAAPEMPPARWRWLVAAWNLALAASLVLGFFTGFWSVALLVLAAMAGLGLWLRPRVLHALHAAEAAAAELEVFAAALALFENRTFEAPKLQALTASLRAAGLPPSARVRQLAKLAIWITSRDHPAMRVLGPPLLLGTHLAFAADAWRQANGPLVAAWLTALGEMEALLSLAGFAYENPELVWPEWVDYPSPFLDGEALRHPLLDPTRAVPNSLALSPPDPLVLISGSNMSGKSTFLRTLGLAIVMAHAGAPVAARRLRLSRLVVGASISTHDSLQEGASRFFAEISRLREILALAESGQPVLYLLDELLSGTNSRDRRIGAEGILRGLRERRAIGLVTTHDLALAEVSLSRQMHFSDSLQDGKIMFDYRMKPGVVPGSNALALMHALGLPVAGG
ncbi:MAG: DNA mismatch repair protein MutS [Acidobacteria bacterium]|nr:DNA mismatch repair protein MutS [Bryobacteraceae bacterium CoA2 C42]